jgi:hypothetical protein
MCQAMKLTLTLLCLARRFTYLLRLISSRGTSCLRYISAFFRRRALSLFKPLPRSIREDHPSTIARSGGRPSPAPDNEVGSSAQECYILASDAGVYILCRMGVVEVHNAETSSVPRVSQFCIVRSEIGYLNCSATNSQNIDCWIILPSSFPHHVCFHPSDTYPAWNQETSTFFSGGNEQIQTISLHVCLLTRLNLFRRLNPTALSHRKTSPKAIPPLKLDYSR